MKKQIINPKISIGELHELLDDPKTKPIIMFEQMMDYLCEKNYKNYIKTLKEIGKWVDEAREQHPCYPINLQLMRKEKITFIRK